jgi:peptide subunit release factor RF-3
MTIFPSPDPTVVKYRLEAEYGAHSRIEVADWTLARWLRDAGIDTGRLVLPTGSRIARDKTGQSVLLLPTEWNLRYFIQNNKDCELSEYPAMAPEDVLQRVA